MPKHVASSSSIGATACCELWPVEQCPSILSYLSPTLTIFSLPGLEDLFLLLLSILSWVFLFVSSLPVLEWRSFWSSYSPPFSTGDPANLFFAPLSKLLYFLLYSTLLVLHSPSSYLGPYILLNIFLSIISRACSSFFVIVHVSAPYVTAGLINVLHNLYILLFKLLKVYTIINP